MKKLLILILAAVSIVGCKTKYIEVPVEKIKTEYINTLDSIYIHDSIWTQIQSKNDTVYVDRYKLQVKEVHRVDTIQKVDTISKTIPVEVIKRVEVNKVYFWQKALMALGGLVIFAIVLLLIYKIAKWKLLH